MLTKKQELFVQELLKGKSQREAYRAAYTTDKMKEATIDQLACRLFKNVKVRARYDALYQKSIEKTEDDATSMRAFIIETYKKIASGEICKQKIVKDGQGVVIRQEAEVMPSDVSNALAKLSVLYGVDMATEDKTITVRFDDGSEDYTV